MIGRKAMYHQGETGLRSFICQNACASLVPLDDCMIASQPRSSPIGQTSKPTENPIRLKL